MGGISMQYDQAIALGKEKLALKTVKSLIECGFDAVYVKTKEEAADYVMQHCTKGMSVGFGGSTTTTQMDLAKRVDDLGATVISHSLASTPQEKLDLMRKEQLCDLFISSTNAITMEGTLINIDAIGNRVGAMMFGPSQVAVIAGINKVFYSKDEAYDYLRKVTCPVNNIRLDYPTPCVKTGYCVDCKVERRMCRAYTELRRRPLLTPFLVVIVGEELGF
jgi:hypothetical protein